MKIDKQELVLKCQEIINERVLLIKQNMTHAQNSANEETKSSAGDKYETGRAIAQLERDKAAIQLSEALKLKKVIDQLSRAVKLDAVDLGSIVQTDQGIFFISVSLGRIDLNNVDIIAISPVSPLGHKFMKCKSGDLVEFNDRTYNILLIS